MMARRPTIEPKKPIYLGCEGDSEVAFGQVINDLLQSRNVPIFLHTESLAPAAGDPLTRVQRAVQRIKELNRKRGRFYLKAILMDSDQVADVPQRAAQARKIATRENIGLIWQDPCHEAVLLRHMAGCSAHRPPTCTLAERALKAQWPAYNKPMARAQLAERINFDAIHQAATVEPELRAFLENIGLLP